MSDSQAVPAALSEAHEQQVRRAARIVAAGFREVGWKWGGSFDTESGHVPDAFEVADVIRRLVGNALTLKPGQSTGTGGIDVWRHEDDEATVSIELALDTLWSEDA